MVQWEVVTTAWEHLTCHSRNGNHRILHSHQDGILHNLHIQSRVQPQPHACHSSPCCSRIHHSLHSHGILRILRIQSRARQQPWVRPQPHACRSIPCRVLHSRSCGIHQDRIHHTQSRAQQQLWAQPQPHACRSILHRGLRIHSCGIHRIHQGRSLRSRSKAQQQPWVRPWPRLQARQQQGPPGRELRASSCC